MKNQIRILFFIPSKTRCGPTNVAYNIIQYLKSKGVIVYLAYLWEGDRPEHDFVNKYIDEQINLDGFGLKSFFKLVSFIKQKRPTLFHSHCMLPDIYGSILKVFFKDIKFISTLHCNLDEDYNSTYSKSIVKRYSYKKLHKFFLANLDEVAAVSNNAKKSLTSKNVNIIHNGTDKAYVPTILPHESPIQLLYVGVLTKRKNVEFLINAFSALNNENYELLIVGDGDEDNALKIQANNKKNIKFYGYSNKPEQFFTDRTVFVNPSKSEGLPMAVIEALSLGTPCLLSNIPSHREISELSFHGVFIFDFNYKSFKKSLESITFNKTQSKKIKYEHYKNLSIDAMGDKYLNLYNKEKEV